MIVGIIVRNTLVTYDRQNLKVGFWKTNCSELWHRLNMSDTSTAIPSASVPNAPAAAPNAPAPAAVPNALAPAPAPNSPAPAPAPNAPASAPDAPASAPDGATLDSSTLGVPPASAPVGPLAHSIPGTLVKNSC